jgi:hypothetical protein
MGIYMAIKLIQKLKNNKFVRIFNDLPIKKINQLAIFIIAVTFLVGIIYSLRLGDDLRYVDESMYYIFSKNLLEKSLFSLDGVHPTAVKSPGISFFYYLVLSIYDSIILLRIFNFIALSISLLLIFLIIQELSNSKFALLGLILASISPLFFYTASTLYPQTVATTLLLIILYIIRRNQKLNTTNYFILGILAGILIITIPSFLPLMMVVALWRIFDLKDYKGILFLMTIAILVNIPWTIRNYKLFDSFVFITTDGGTNFILGNSENTTPNAGVNTDISNYKQDVVENSFNEFQTDQYYKKQALNWINENKLDAIKLYFLKFLNHFNFRNKLKTGSESSNLRDILSGISYYPFLLFYILRIITFRKIPIMKQEWFYVILYLSWGLIMAIFFTRIRYRLPLDSVLIIISSLFVYQVIKYFNKDEVKIQE